MSDIKTNNIPQMTADKVISNLSDIYSAVINKNLSLKYILGPNDFRMLLFTPS